MNANHIPLNAQAEDDDDVICLDEFHKEKTRRPLTPENVMPFWDGEHFSDLSDDDEVEQQERKRDVEESTSENNSSNCITQCEAAREEPQLIPESLFQVENEISISEINFDPTIPSESMSFSVSRVPGPTSTALNLPQAIYYPNSGSSSSSSPASLSIRAHKCFIVECGALFSRLSQLETHLGQCHQLCPKVCIVHKCGRSFRTRYVIENPSKILPFFFLSLAYF
jgi:hypothetical protein